jgi:4-amino-4-deoxy-L-arabinose transferase-like glycosyltransferase
VLEANADQVAVNLDGSVHTFPAPIDRPWASVRLVQPDPTEREYQVDGSDVTSRKDRDPDEIRAFEASPLYKLDAWLRDESSYSRWEDVRLVDADTGQIVAQGLDAVQSASLPTNFVLEASLRRPEAAALVDLVATGPAYHGVVEIGRDNKTVTWSVGERGSQQKGSWFFPEQSAPFAAELLQLLGRSAAIGFVLLLLAWAIAQLLARTPIRLPVSLRIPLPAAIVCVGVLWLVAACWVTIRLYHQLPHIVDAAAYFFEANVLASGQVAFEPPPMVGAFKGYFQTVVGDRWFAQYPPGAPALFALGSLLGMAWLVGPLSGVTMIVATALAARHLFGSAAALAALVLAALSPFILFQAGSFMSHSVAGAALAVALAAFAYAERSQRPAWYALAGACLGWGLLTRELSTVLFGIPLVVWLLVWRRWRGLAFLIGAGAPFVLAYLAYNAALTGNPLLLPRNSVNASDVYGFVSSADLHHTLAAGLDYADQNLTLLQFDLFGWPPLFAFSLLCLPFLLGRAGRYDVLLAGSLLVYLLGYLGVPGAGIVLGPRYYYEALPLIVLLAVRGLQVLTETLRAGGLPSASARAAVVGVVVLLSLNTLFFYDPHLVARRTDYFAMDRNRGVALPFVENTLFGPRLTGFTGPSLVLVPDEVAYKTLSALNCRLLDRQHIQDCPVLFASAGTGDASKLAQAYPGRALFVARVADGAVSIEPYLSGS